MNSNDRAGTEQEANAGFDSEYVMAEAVIEVQPKRSSGGGDNEMDREVGSLNIDELVESKTRLGVRKQASSVREPLTGETFSVLSRANIESLSFNDKFELLFNDLSMLRASAIRGQLADTNMRCLAWMIFLGCVPMQRSEWLKELAHKRHVYDRIKEEICCDPHAAPKKQSADDATEPAAHPSDHPLSQTDQSQWNKYFYHNELKAVIIQDVNRINQHSEFFTQQSTLDLIVDLLFIYVQITNSEYKQGMHELLTCIMYVIHEEYTKLSQMNDANELIRTIADLKYLEHDTYTIFCALMNTMHEWFGTKSDGSAANRRETLSNLAETQRRNSFLTVNPVLFKSYDDEMKENVIINKINYITNKILKENESEIFDHLQEVDVTLHPFGIRWLRLLFLRELEFPACLILWDAIFAVDNQEFGLVDYIFVALLASLRDRILHADNSSCMRLLMQPHFHLDPIDVLNIALYYQSPEIYSRPAFMDTSFEIINYNNNNNNNNSKSLIRQSPSSNFQSTPNKSAISATPNVVVTTASASKTPAGLLNASGLFSTTVGGKDSNNNKMNASLNTSSSATASGKNNGAVKGQEGQQDLAKIAKKLDYDYSLAPPTSTTASAQGQPGSKASGGPSIANTLPMKLFGFHESDSHNEKKLVIYEKKIMDLQEENLALKMKLEELNDLCLMCSTKMNAHICLLQEEIMKSMNVTKDDIILLGIAGLKQIRDQLNPSFQSSKQEDAALGHSIETGAEAFVGAAKSSSSSSRKVSLRDQLTQTSFDQQVVLMASPEHNSLIQAGATIKDKFTSLFKSGEGSANNGSEEAAPSAPSASSISSAKITEKLKSFSSNLKSVNPFTATTAASSALQKPTAADEDPDLAADYHYIEDDNVQMNPGNMRLVMSEDSQPGAENSREAPSEQSTEGGGGGGVN